MHCWLYVSKAKVAPRSADEARIYLQARSQNAAHRVSGYLHRENGHYVQYIEGPRAALDQLKRLIRLDWRHADVRVLCDTRIQARRFSGWDMAFTDEETSSFRSYQALFGRETDVSRASSEAFLDFMDATALGGTAQHAAEFTGTAASNPMFMTGSKVGMADQMAWP